MTHPTYEPMTPEVFRRLQLEVDELRESVEQLTVLMPLQQVLHSIFLLLQVSSLRKNCNI